MIQRLEKHGLSSKKCIVRWLVGFFVLMCLTVGATEFWSIASTEIYEAYAYIKHWTVINRS